MGGAALTPADKDKSGVLVTKVGVADESGMPAVYKEPKRPEWKKNIEKFLENWFVVGLMSVVTIYALFFDDLRIIFLPKEADFVTDIITMFAITLYLIELTLGCIAIEGYFFSFFFWVDLVSLLSMLPDVSIIVSTVEGGLGGADSASDIAKTGRATKVVKIIRIIRLIRLLRIVKIYKQV